MHRPNDQSPNFANVPRFDWSRSHDVEYVRQYGLEHERVVGFKPMMGADDDDEVTVKKSELDGLKRGIAEKDRELRDFKKDTGKQIEALEAKIEESGTGDAAEKLERKVERLEGKLEEAVTAKSEAEQKLESTGRERKALDVAGRLNFRNPARAIRLLESDDLESEDATERALEKLAREEPYMVTTKKQRDVTDPDPKNKGGKDNDDGDEGGKKPEEPAPGKARMRAAYEASEKEAAKAASGSGDAGEGGTD
jgi:hypothetical protein